MPFERPEGIFVEINAVIWIYSFCISTLPQIAFIVYFPYSFGSRMRGPLKG